MPPTPPVIPTELLALFGSIGTTLVGAVAYLYRDNVSLRGDLLDLTKQSLTRENESQRALERLSDALSKQTSLYELSIEYIKDRLKEGR